MVEQISRDRLVDEIVLDGGEAEHVSALLQMGSGRLNVTGGADTLLRGRLAYAAAQWRPEVRYEVEEGQGQLKVKGPERYADLVGNPHYAWDLALGSVLPVALRLQLGSGEAALHLSETRLEALDVAVGSGKLQADLSGELSNLGRISLKTGSGATGLVLAGAYPSLEDVGVSIASGVANLALDGDYSQLTRLKVNNASGRIALALGGAYPQLGHVALNTASGVTEVALTSGLADGLKISLNCVSGVAVVTYPPEVGISYRFTALSGKLDAPGFTRQGDRYVNAAYAEAAVKVEVKMSSVSGKLTLQPRAS